MTDYTPLAYVQRFLPEELRRNKCGVRPSIAKILDLIDVDAPTFGAVASVLSDMVQSGVELDEQSVSIALKMAGLNAKPSPAEIKRKQREKPQPQLMSLPMWGDRADQESIVYYVQRGPLVKIGTTTDPRSRFNDLVPDEILAFEPGDRRIESYRHRQFVHLRRGNREYFETDKSLLKHIKRVRKMHGDPDPQWSTTENVGLVEPSLPKVLRRPEWPQTGTPIELARLLGISPNTVRSWIHRGQIKPIPGGTVRRPQYFFDHVLEMAKESAAWVEYMRKLDG